MTIHLGDDFAQRGPKDLGHDLGPHGEWPRPQTPPRPTDVTLRSKKRAVTPQDWDQASSDSTNMSMLEQGLVQPGDL
jgi:hypothetical protein